MKREQLNHALRAVTIDPAVEINCVKIIRPCVPARHLFLQLRASRDDNNQVHPTGALAVPAWQMWPSVCGASGPGSCVFGKLSS